MPSADFFDLNSFQIPFLKPRAVRAQLGNPFTTGLPYIPHRVIRSTLRMMPMGWP
jgi:hypothetical protein